jgi:hypothetical protein
MWKLTLGYGMSNNLETHKIRLQVGTWLVSWMLVGWNLELVNNCKTCKIFIYLRFCLAGGHKWKGKSISETRECIFLHDMNTWICREYISFCRPWTVQLWKRLLTNTHKVHKGWLTCPFLLSHTKYSPKYVTLNTKIKCICWKQSDHDSRIPCWHLCSNNNVHTIPQKNLHTSSQVKVKLSSFRSVDNYRGTVRGRAAHGPLKGLWCWEPTNAPSIRNRPSLNGNHVYLDHFMFYKDLTLLFS